MREIILVIPFNQDCKKLLKIVDGFYRAKFLKKFLNLLRNLYLQAITSYGLLMCQKISKTLFNRIELMQK